MKHVVASLIRLAALAACGRYEGSGEAGPPEVTTAAEAKDITFTVVIRDVFPLDLYDDSCRLVELPPDQILMPPEHELVVTPRRRDGTDAPSATFEVPKLAVAIPGGCEAPGVNVKVPAADEYSAGVATAGQGIQDPTQPIFPHTFGAHDGATVAVFE